MSSVKNAFGISIRKCCASCQHVKTKGVDTHACKLGFRGEGRLFPCKEGKWQMKPSLENAGKGGGRVKKYEYLRILASKGALEAEEWARIHGGKYVSSR